MKLGTFLELGRTSNLPTVWSNVLCGVVLSGAAVSPVVMAVLVVAGSALYVGGMLLNDAFDAELDARLRPERPIPSRRVSRRTVFGLGLALLLGGIALVASASALGAIARGPAPTVAALGTAAAVLVYDRWHKGHAWSPLVMGLCRAGLYFMAALAASGTLPRPVWIAAAGLLAYVVGLTYVARFENATVVGRLWPTLFVLAPLLLAAPSLGPGRVDICWVSEFGWTVYALRLALRGGPGRIPRAVVALIAGISLVDATFMASYASFGSVLAFVAFTLTTILQQRIRGT